MYQAWILGTTLAAGAGLVALTVTLQNQSPPPVTPEPAPAAVHVIPPAPPAPISEPTDSTRTLELEPLVISAPRHRASLATPPEPTTAERPCSHWRDLGPTHVVSGQPSGALQVRELCL